MLNTLKKSQSSNFLNNSLSSPNLFNKPFPVKRDLNPSLQIDSKIILNLQAILSSFTYSCCCENVIKVLPSGQLAKIHRIYIMPCGHNICHKCIRTILENIPGSMISCSNSDCTERYLPQEAEVLFVKNLLITSFAEKLWKIKCQQELITKQQFKTTQKVRHEFKTPEPILSQPQNMKNGCEMEMEIEGQKQGSMRSSESSFHECANTFCRKPTQGFFCSKVCQEIQEELDGDMNSEVISEQNKNENDIII